MYEQHGLFNLQLRSAADYELMLRFFHFRGATLAYLPRTTVKMRAGGQSNASLGNRIKANAEDAKAWRLNGSDPACSPAAWSSRCGKSDSSRNADPFAGCSLG